MSSLRSQPVSRVLLGAFILIALVLTYRSSMSQAGIANFVKMTDRSAANPITKLEVSLKQTSSSPATIQVSVTNKNDYPVTVLSYDSPLDTMALKLGLVSITPAGASKALTLPKVAVRRMMPPPDDALIPIAAGESVTKDIVFGGRDIGQDVLSSVSKASVHLSGKWQAVWAKEKGDLEEVNLGGAQPDPNVHSGTFSSKAIDVAIGQ